MSVAYLLNRSQTSLVWVQLEHLYLSWCPPILGLHLSWCQLILSMHLRWCQLTLGLHFSWCHNELILRLHTS